MNILDAFHRYGLEPKRKTASEWAAPCPGCGGKDRCILWPNHPIGTGGRFHCRQCGLTGDTIDFLQQFGGMSYQEACKSTGKTKYNLARGKRLYIRHNQANSFPARQSQCDFPPEKWIKAAAAFLADCQTDEALFCENALVRLAIERFIPPGYARNVGIGWHNRNEYPDREKWGLPKNDKRQKLALPMGIVIATRRKIGIVSLTIRRIGNDQPKYWQVAGGARDVPYMPQFKPNLPIFLLESALDAALLCREAGQICNSVALGGTCKSVDPDTMAFIKAAPLRIVSPDTDEAGDEISDRWQKLFHPAWLYRAIGAKDIGEMHKLAMSVDGQRIPTAGAWAAHAIEFCRQNRS